jgi:hypothetical protein
MSNVSLSAMLALFAGMVAVTGCASHDAEPAQTGVGGVASIGGLSGYGYAGTVSYGGYPGFGTQPWAGAVSKGTSSTGGDFSVGGRSTATGGLSATGGALATGGAAAFDWGTSVYNITGGSSLGHQGHNTGAACLATCHAHTFQAGGTIYQADATTTSANVQIGILMNGTLSVAYSGSQGNFYLPIAGTLDWTTAQIAIRTSAGVAIHPSVSGLSGSCNSCHNSSNRIVVP